MHYNKRGLAICIDCKEHCFNKYTLPIERNHFPAKNETLKILHSIYFASEVGIIRSYSNRILKHIVIDALISALCMCNSYCISDTRQSLCHRISVSIFIAQHA